MKLKVLLIDDDTSLREIIKDVLEMNGYKVIEASDGLEGFEKFKNENVDIIVTDLMMDNLNGIDFIKKIKSEYQDIPPIILMTGYGSVESVIEAFKLGIKDYIIKPFKISLLLNVIERVLKQASIERENLQLKEVISLYTASEKINNSIYLDEIGKIFVESIQDLTKASIVALYLKDEDFNILKIQKEHFKVSPKYKPKENQLFKKFNIELPVDEVKKVIGDKKYYINFKKTPFWNDIGEVHQSIIFPLQTATNFLGILIIISLTPTIILSEEKIKAFKIIINESSIALENAYLFKRQEEMFFQTLNSLALTIDAKDRYTHGHSLKVTKYAEIIAKYMGLDSKTQTSIIEGGLLHDIGKIGIPDSVLLKPGALNDVEYKIIKTHPVIGKNILEPLKKNFGKVIDIVYHHHERFDGKGYPERLKGKEIPLEVRIITVADSFDAMTSDRAYRRGMPVEKGVEELIKNKGTQFDPEIVDIFIDCFSEIKKYYKMKPEDIVFKLH